MTEPEATRDEKTPGVLLLCACGRGNGAASEFPENRKGMWETLCCLKLPSLLLVSTSIHAIQKLSINLITGTWAAIF